MGVNEERRLMAKAYVLFAAFNAYVFLLQVFIIMFMRDSLKIVEQLVKNIS